MTGRALAAMAALVLAATQGAPNRALAQGISAQPLPPPGAPPATGSPPAASHRVPVVKPATHPAARTKPKATKPPAVARPAVPKPAAARPAAPPPAAPAAPPPPKLDPTKGTSTGLPLPRWVSFRSDDVNLRSGPGTQYPIDWVYHRRDYPVQVLREFEVWRLVQTEDGTKGWVHQATLTGRRGFVVQNGEQVLRAGAADTADAVAQLEPGVVGHVKQCPQGSGWCQVQSGAYGGWLKRDALFGVSPDEMIQ